MKSPIMYSVEAEKIPLGFRLFLNGRMVAEGKTERELDRQLHFHGVLGR